MRFWVARMRWEASLKWAIASSKTGSSLVTSEVYVRVVGIPLAKQREPESYDGLYSFSYRYAGVAGR